MRQEDLFRLVLSKHEGGAISNLMKKKHTEKYAVQLEIKVITFL